MNWIKCSDREPIPEDSPILAIGSLKHFDVYALQYTIGWDGSGWYSADREYGLALEPGDAFYHPFSVIKYWMPLPKLPEDI